MTHLFSAGRDAASAAPSGASELRDTSAAPTEGTARPTFYRPELDALRLFAFLCVFVNHLRFPGTSHVTLWQTGGFGLQLFFLLSSYLIVSLLQREAEATRTVRVGAFMLRRILRIWPLYFAAILLNQCIGLFWKGGLLDHHAVLSMLLLSTNLYVLQNGWTLQMLSALWSIAVEEQFYVVIPWIGRFGTRRILTGFLLTVFAIAYLVLIHLGRAHADTMLRVWPNSFVQFQFFAAGGLLALSGFRLRQSLPVRLVFLCAGLGLWLVAQRRFAIHLYSQHPSTAASLCAGYFLVLVGSLAIFLAFLGTTFRFPRWVLYFGTISYGLYVFQDFWIFLVFGGFHLEGRSTWGAGALALLGTAISAALSYRYFERPVLRFKRHFEPVRTRI